MSIEKNEATVFSPLRYLKAAESAERVHIRSPCYCQMKGRVLHNLEKNRVWKGVLNKSLQEQGAALRLPQLSAESCPSLTQGCLRRQWMM